MPQHVDSSRGQAMYRSSSANGRVTPDAFVAVSPPRRVDTTPGPRFATVHVARDFAPRDYGPTFAALQQEACSKLLELVSVRLLPTDMFHALAHAWTAPAGFVPRLAIIVTFERWVLIRATALAALRPIVDRGVGVELFYAEQGEYLDDWFEHGEVLHNLAPVIADLAARWQPSTGWASVVSTLASLVRAHTVVVAELPVLLTELAGIALSCGDAAQAATLASEALLHLGDVPSSTRSKALRGLGAAMLANGHASTGLAIMEEAIEMAALVEAPTIAATALCQTGLYALNHGQYSAAEERFRRAIEVLSTRAQRPHLLALALHNLGIALLFQGKRDDAARHAAAALALRSNSTSHLAEQDRLLLSLCKGGSDDS